MTPDKTALLLGLAAVLLWSTVATAFKLALRELDVFQLVAYAVSWSTLSLLALLVCQGKLALLGRYFRDKPLFALGMGLLNPLAYYLILLHAYDLLPAQQAQAINYTWAIMLSLLAVPLLGHRLSYRDLLAVMLAYVGVLIIATKGSLLALAFDSLAGVMLALASTVLWALYWIFSTRNEREPVVSLCLNFICALPIAWIVCVAFSSVGPVSSSSLAATAYIGFFEMGLTFVLWSAALRLSTAVSRVANLIFLSPLISLVFITLILDEAIHPATLVGLGLIIPALLIQQSQQPSSAHG